MAMKSKWQRCVRIGFANACPAPRDGGRYEMFVLQLPRVVGVSNENQLRFVEVLRALKPSVDNAVDHADVAT